MLALYAPDLVIEQGAQRLNWLSPDPDGRLAGQLPDFRGESLRLLLELGALLFELAGDE
jgi:hypothetical protein